MLVVSRRPFRSSAEPPAEMTDGLTLTIAEAGMARVPDIQGVLLGEETRTVVTL